MLNTLPLTATDDNQLVVVRRDFSGGMNNRQYPNIIGDNQADTIESWNIGVVGEIRKIPGITLIEDLGSNAGMGALGFEPRGGTNELLVIEGGNLKGWTGTTFSLWDAGFASGLATTMIKATCSGAEGDVVLISNGSDYVHEMHQDHSVHDLGTGNTDCPLTTVLTFYRNRVWALKANLLYWSAALPATYDAQFDRTTNNYNITVGKEQAIIGIRDQGLICFGSDAVYGINPSITPAATDKPEKILDIGCVAGNTAVQVGDDVYFLAKDGVRGVFRTAMDKLQMEASYPISFNLKSEFESISWAYISKSCAVYFDNKYFIALPVDSSSYNNEVWVYYPVSKSWMVITGWNVGAWAKLTVDGEERLYFIDSTTGHVYRAWYGNDNNGTAITATFRGREEDMAQPLNYKNGGEIEIATLVAGSGNTLSVNIALDGGGFQALGEIDLTSTTAPILNTASTILPFYLADAYIVREKFHLDSLGRWRTIQVELINSDKNTDPIVVYEYNIVTFMEEYEAE